MLLLLFVYKLVSISRFKGIEHTNLSLLKIMYTPWNEALLKAISYNNSVND